ncbi:peptide deformylase [Megalodesulfovibrio gigas]|uniref:Peptide deformylase n=1 Tax=Megalodesulfovibrio gigas (strain ATCC 19364 / DSM 1382 / NCIMB 9332 / VKM B-1759) TaxID=1121448 RepID=T2G8X3_MEGG1|nr:peptide deformylase [Megalodesulfovibrio gigas]AGW12743.1 putative peptide deformylase [Megalodesulfovibrio gigas DSM 1382 = ATCC 19364]
MDIEQTLERPLDGKILPLCTWPDPVLGGECTAVRAVTDEIMDLARNMAATMYASQGIGLAAPQIGQPLRMIVVDVTGPDKREQLITLLNPVIEHAEGCIDSDEGCLSLPQFRANVERAEVVRVRGQDLEGNEVVIEAEGLLAVCLQHEIDHLRGVLLIDKVGRLKRSMYERKIAKRVKRA